MRLLSVIKKDFMRFLFPSTPASQVLLVTLLFLDCLELEHLYSVLSALSHCYSVSVPCLNGSSAYCCPLWWGLHCWVLNFDSCLIILDFIIKCFWRRALLPRSLSQSQYNLAEWKALGSPFPPLEPGRCSCLLVRSVAARQGDPATLGPAPMASISPLEFQRPHGTFTKVANFACFSWDTACPLNAEVSGFLYS